MRVEMDFTTKTKEIIQQEGARGEVLGGTQKEKSRKFGLLDIVAKLEKGREREREKEISF